MSSLASKSLKVFLHRGACYSTLTLLMLSTDYVGASRAYAQAVSYQDIANTVEKEAGGDNNRAWIVGTSKTPNAGWGSSGNYGDLDRTTGNVQSSGSIPSSTNVIVSGEGVSYFRPGGSFKTSSDIDGWAANIAVVNGASFQVGNISIAEGANVKTVLYIDDNSKFINTGTTQVNDLGILDTHKGYFSTDSLISSGVVVLGNNSTISTNITNNNGGVMTLNGTNVSPSVTTTNSGQLTANGATIGGLLTNTNGANASLSGGSVGSVQNGGTLTLDNGVSVANTVTTANGSVLNVKSGGARVASLSGGGSGTIDGRLTLSDAKNDTYSGNLDGQGGVTIASGTETLSGQNSYKGTTRVEKNGTLQLTGSVQGGLDNIGQTTVSGGTVGGTSTNSGTLQSTNGTLGVVDNTASGTAVLTGGRADSVNNAGGQLSLDGTTVANTVNSTDGHLTVTTNGATVGSLSGNSNGTVDGRLTLSDAKNDTYSGTLDGQGGVTIASGTETLSGQNSYKGITRVEKNGTLQLTGSVQGGLDTIGQTTVSGGTVGGTSTNSGLLTVQKNGQIVDLQNEKGATAHLQDGGTAASVRNDGTLFINDGHVTGTSTNSGTLQSTNGTLGVVDNTASGTAVLTGGRADSVNNAGGQLSLDGTTVANTVNSTDGHLTVTTNGATVGSLSGNSNGTVDGRLTLSDAKNDTYSGTLDGQGGVTIASGTETLSGQNSYKGITRVEKNGTLQLTGSVQGGLDTIGQTTVSGGTVGGTSTNSGLLTVQKNGQIVDLQNEKDATAHLQDGGTAASVRNDGTLFINDGHVTGTSTNSGTLQSTNGTLGVVDNTASGTAVLTGGRADSVNNAGGQLSLDGTTVANTVNSTDGHLTVMTNGATVGSLSGNSNGTVDGRLTLFDAKNDTYSGTLDGQGGVTIASGTETLSGQNHYSGGTEVVHGAVLRGGVQSFGSGMITDNGQLYVRNDQEGSFANSLQGAGLFEKDGAGTLEVTGNSPEFTGVTRLSGGTMAVSGSLAGSSMDVNNGTLTGNGTVGATHVGPNGTLQTLNDGRDQAFHVAGDLTVDKGAHVAVTGTGRDNGQTLALDHQSYQQLSSSHIAVAGKAVINGGSLSLMVADPSTFKERRAYTLISADGGVTGSHFDHFDTNLTNHYVFLSPSLMYTSDAVSFAMERNGVSFASVGHTRNEIETGRALDYVPTSNPVSFAMAGLEGAEARQATRSLSGEIHASARTALIQDSTFVRQAALDRLDSADCDGMVAGGMGTYDLKTHRKTHECQVGHPVLWGQAYGSMGHNSSDGNAGTLHHSTAGFVMGLDGLVAPNTRLGGLISYGHSMFDTQQGRNSSGRSDNITIGTYGSHHWGNIHVRAGASYSWNVMSTHRTAMVGSYSDRLTSNYRGGTAQGFGELSYKFHTRYAVIEPFANAAYVNMHTDGYREHGGAAALRGYGTDTGVTFSTFGVHASGSFNVGKMLFSPHGTLAYRHAFGTLAPSVHQSFVAGSGGDMNIAGTPLSKDSAVLDTGISARLTQRINVDLSYMGQYGNQSVDSGARANVSYAF